MSGRREREGGREIFSDSPTSDRVWLVRLTWEGVCEGGREGVMGNTPMSQGCLRACWDKQTRQGPDRHQL